MNWQQKLLVLVAAFTATGGLAQEALSLRLAEEASLYLEPGAVSMQEQARSLDELSIAVGQLPDPILMLSAMNLPIDTFNLDQEAMTQLRVAIKQPFPRGDTLEINSSKALVNADRMRILADNRKLMVLRSVRQLWLEVFYWEHAYRIVDQNVHLFEQLRDTTHSFYRVGRKGLDDVVRGELEVQRLRDRQIAISENIDKQRAMLARWVQYPRASWALTDALPAWELHVEETDFNELVGRLITRHPVIAALDKSVETLGKDVDLARQQYKPEWSLEIAYANRNARRVTGETVPDFASVALTVSLPVFPGRRQDKTLAAAEHGLIAGQDNRLEAVRNVAAEWDAERRRYEKVRERLELHTLVILPQSDEQSKASLLAYQSDTSDFTEVMRASIAFVEAQLVLERLRVDVQRSLASLRYLIPPGEDIELINASLSKGGS